MKWITFFLVFYATFFAEATNSCLQHIDVDISPIEGILKNLLEELLNRFDVMERKLSKLETELNEHREEVERNCIPVCVTPTSSTPQVDSTTPTTLPTTTTTQPTVTQPPTYASCQDAPANVSGVYLIRINNTSSPFKVYCEMESFGGGWIVVQHRFDGSVDFYRNWVEYRDGFGEFGNEFWLGLEDMHQLTTTRKYEIVFEMKDFEGNYGYARYNRFHLGSEKEQFRLILGSYSGTAGDSMIDYNKGAKFSTKDRDNNGFFNNLAVHCEGAWCYGENTYSNLNGLYKNDSTAKSILWYRFKKDRRGMSFTRMMIREL